MDEHNHTEHSAEAHEHKKEPVRELSVPGAIVINGLIIAVAIIIAALMLGGRFSGTAQNAQPSATAGDPSAAAPQPTLAVDIKNVTTAGEPTVGNPQAPVVLAYWSDYQCPFCKMFETTTFQTILKNYVQSGKVKVVFKDFTFLGPDSTTAALYARAVWDLYPDTYFAWREAMYNAQDGENAGFGDEASILKLTATVPGIDAAKVKAQVTAKTDVYQKSIDADRAEAASMGIQGTPSFIIGTKLISGNSPLSDFTAALDAQLK